MPVFHIEIMAVSGKTSEIPLQLLSGFSSSSVLAPKQTPARCLCNGAMAANFVGRSA